MTTKINFAVGLALALGVSACDDNSTNTLMDMAMSNMPAAPTLGPAIDRMGRPAINTALNNAFNPDDATKGAGKDEYNAEANQDNWATTLQINNKKVATEFAGNLAIVDALDGKCGNQLLAKGDGTGDAGATEYTTLPSVLTDDELYVDTSIGDCAATTIPNYLAVEARAVNIPLNFTSCGGRTPLDDTIDVSYTLLAAGLSGTVVTDGIAQDNATPASLSTFPFLSAPN